MHVLRLRRLVSVDISPTLSKYNSSIESLARKFHVVDLFAGAGGFSLAAQYAGCVVEFAIECDKHAASTYRKNFCQGFDATTLYEQDIFYADPHALAEKHFNGTNRCDLVLGGPPCQGFSTHRIKDAGVDDPRNALTFRYLSFVDALRPKAFLMENVPGILWPRHASYLDAFFNDVKKAGYIPMEPVKLDARDYGVPQRRNRVFFLGLRKDISIEDFTWPPKSTHAPEGINGLKEWENCADAFKAAPEGDPNSIHMNHGAELICAFENTPLNGGSRKDSGRILKCHENHDGHKDVYGRIDKRKPAPTMTTACINPSKGRFVHPVEHHGITVRQAARIQTFPDDFKFDGGLISAGQQVGNAVPIKLGEILIHHIMEILLQHDKCIARNEEQNYLPFALMRKAK